MERILILGGAGFIGSKLAFELTSTGHEVTVLDAFRHSEGASASDFLAALDYREELLESTATIRGDVTSTMDLLQAFDLARPTRVIHLAAVARPPLNDLHVTEALQTATLPVAKALQLASRVKLARFLLVSSSYVYGDFGDQPCNESHPCSPRTVYGAVKLSAEVLTRALAARFDVPCTIARLIAVYGPGDLNGKLSLPNLRRAAHEGLLPIGGSPSAVTDYTYIDDAVKGLRAALLLDDAAGETFNLSRGQGWSVEQVAQTLSALGYPAVPTGAPALAVGRPRRGTLDSTKAKQLLSFSPTVDLEEGLAHCLRFLTSRQTSE